MPDFRDVIFLSCEMKHENERMVRAIKKYRSGLYDENDFHQTVLSIIASVIESHFFEQRQCLIDVEAELELIDVTVNKELVRDSYLRQIQRMEDMMNQA